MNRTSTRLKVGILGTRHVHAAGLASGLRSLGCEIVSAWDDDAQARDAWDGAVARSRDELLQSAEAIVVAGTNNVRTADAIAALDAGVAVLAEKPVAIHADELQQLTRAAANKRFMACLPLRFAPPFVQARDALRAGQIGRPLAARGTNHGQFPGAWFGDPDLAGGGALVDHVVHVSDGLCWLLGERAQRIYAVCATRMHPGLAVDDCGVVTLDYGSGLFASVDASWSRPESFETWGDVFLEIVGDEGRMIIDPMAQQLVLYDDRLGKRRSVPFGADSTKAMLAAFVNYVRHGGDAPVSIDEAAHASQTVFAAYRSVASGRPEPIAATESLAPAS